MLPENNRNKCVQYHADMFAAAKRPQTYQHRISNLCLCYHSSILETMSETNVFGVCGATFEFAHFQEFSKIHDTTDLVLHQCSPMTAAITHFLFPDYGWGSVTPHVVSDGGESENYYAREMGHRGELRDDRPAFKSYALGASLGKVSAPKAAQNEPQKKNN